MQLSEQSTNQNITTSSPLTPDIHAFQTLAQRYGTDAILWGEINQASFSTQWQSHWYLSFMHKVYRWSITSKNKDDLIQKTFQNIVTTLASNTSTHDADMQTETILLHISNVSNLQAYTMLSQYINQFNRTKEISLDSLSSNTAIFRITLQNDDIDSLIQYLNKNKRLYFIKQENTSLKTNLQNITPVLYYNYGQTITPQYQTERSVAF
jgi:hypothetical protein